MKVTLLLCIMHYLKRVALTFEMRVARDVRDNEKVILCMLVVYIPIRKYTTNIHNIIV